MHGAAQRTARCIIQQLDAVVAWRLEVLLPTGLLRRSVALTEGGAMHNPCSCPTSSVRGFDQRAKKSDGTAAVSRKADAIRQLVKKAAKGRTCESGEGGREGKPTGQRGW